MNVNNKNRVLIVDDNTSNLSVLFKVLQQANFKVLIAESGKSALKRIKYLKPDIILLDIMMPEMDGFETCRRLKADEESKPIPVIFMTALADTADKVKGFELGAVDYITKPVQVEEVVARLNTHLTLCRLQNRLLQQNEQLTQEIAKRQQVEEELRKFSRAVEQSANTIVITDTNGTIEFVNPAFSVKTGYSSTEVIGQNPRVLNSGKQPQECYQQLWSTISSGQVWQGELLNKRKNGELYWEFATISPVKNQSEQITHYVAIKEDITERKRAEQEITRLNERLKGENMRMKAELDVTRQLQQILLPKQEELNKIKGLEIAGFMAPADKVGGDYYDVLQHNGRIKIGIGDVTGHGLESGVLAIMVQTAVRTLLDHDETDPVKILNTINRTIYDNVQRMNSEKNLTLALLDYQDGQLSLSGQHEYLIVVRQGEVEVIDTVDLGFPIGLEEDIADFVAEVKVPLNLGDVVVLYTDGITEAENLQSVLYGLERLCEVVKQNWQRSADEIRQAIITDVRQHIGTQQVYDDITLLVLKQKTTIIV